MARSITILLVEDEPNDVLLVHLALQKSFSGVAIEAVSNGVEAIEYLKGTGSYVDRSEYPFPDLVLVDLKLPIMDGFELLRWIRAQPGLGRLLLVIALTGSLREDDVMLAYAAGANSCVLKAHGFNQLVEAIFQIGGITLPMPFSQNRPSVLGVREPVPRLGGAEVSSAESQAITIETVVAGNGSHSNRAVT